MFYAFLRRLFLQWTTAWGSRVGPRNYATASKAQELGGLQAFLASIPYFKKYPLTTTAPLTIDNEVITSTSETDKTSSTRNVLISFLNRCEIQVPLPIVDFDHDFDAACRQDAARRGYPLEGPYSLAPFIPGGVVLGTTAYAHITDKSTRIFIALYTAFLLCMDDIFQHNIEPVRDFNERFVMKKSQENDVLNSFADMLLEIPKRFARVVSGIMITSSLNFMTGLLLEYETQGMALQKGAKGYPTFSRILSGAAEAFALFIFPQELVLPTFIQAFPEVMVYINTGNDVLSFYKEELNDESVNRISLLAEVEGMPKNKVLWDLTDETVDAHTRALRILEPQTVARDAYLSFATGYIRFHVALSRYKLGDLEL